MKHLCLYFLLTLPLNAQELPTAEIEDVSVAQVAAVCAAMSGVIYNEETGVVSFTPDPFWEEFTTPEELAETQMMVSLSTLSRGAEVMSVWLEGAGKCNALKAELIAEGNLVDD